MINTQTIGALLRTLQQRDPSAFAPPAATPVEPVVAVKAVAGEDAQAPSQNAADRNGAPVPARNGARGTATMPDAAARTSPRLNVPPALLTGAAVVAVRADAAQPSALERTPTYDRPVRLPASAPAGALPAASAAAAAAIVVASPEDPFAIANAGTRALAAPLPAAARPPDARRDAAASAQLDLSPTARQLVALLRAPAGVPRPESATATVTGTTPLLPAPPAGTHAPAGAANALAQALAQEVAHSGLFYEAHLAANAANRYPLAALSREPQAAWSLPAAPVAASPAAGAAALSAGTMEATQDLATGTLAGPEDAGDAVRATAARDTPVETLPPLVRQQLDVLETRQLAWVGELWPGQKARIAIGEDDETARRGDDPSDGAPPVWRTRVELTLPELGTLVVDLALDGSALALDVRAAGSAGATRLAASRADLVSALEAHALAVARVAIRHEPAAQSPGRTTDGATARDPDEPAA